MKQHRPSIASHAAFAAGEINPPPTRLPVSRNGIAQGHPPGIRLWMLWSAAAVLPCILCAAEQPAPPAAPDINSPDVKETKVYDMGDHRIIVQQVTEATLPIQPPPPAVQKAPVEATTLSPEAIAERKARAAMIRNLSFGGTVYLLSDGTRRSRVTWYPSGGGGPIVFWSSADWDLLRVGRFTAPDGLEYHLMNMASPLHIARITAAWAARGRTYQPPNIPAFQPGAASYQIVSGNPTAPMLADLDAVHAFHDRELSALIAARDRREEARRLAAEAAKQPQPPPPDIIIQGRPMTQEELGLPQAAQPENTNP